MDEIDFLEEKVAIIEKKDEVAIAQRAKYKHMTYAQVLQCKENKDRLKRCEEEQEATFNKLIKKRKELKHLKGQEQDLFAEYFTDFLKGKVVSINDFFYVDRLAPIDKRELRKQWLINK